MSFALNNFKMLEKAIDSERERGQRNMVDAVKYPIQTRRASVVLFWQHAAGHLHEAKLEIVNKPVPVTFCLTECEFYPVVERKFRQ